MLVETISYLGPARVLEVDRAKVLIDSPFFKSWATLALPWVYEPALDDSVLVLGQGNEYYVVGVLNGTGKTIITAPGDLELRAPNGAIDLLSSKEVRIQAPKLKLRTKKLEVIATLLRESFSRVHRSVQNTLTITAGRMRTVVDKDYEVRAERISECASNSVRIDGEKINLG